MTSGQKRCRSGPLSRISRTYIRLYKDCGQKTRDRKRDEQSVVIQAIDSSYLL